MQVTLLQTRKKLDIARQCEDGSTETVGSFEISISDPAFVKKSEQLVAELETRGFEDPDYDYSDFAAKCRALLDSAIIGGPEVVDGILGKDPDFYNSMLILTAVMQQVNILNPGKHMVDQLNRFVPDSNQLSQETSAAKAGTGSRSKAKR